VNAELQVPTIAVVVQGNHAVGRCPPAIERLVHR
jgi:hypothetical protein